MRMVRALAWIWLVTGCGGEALVASMTGGTAHSCALLRDGRVACWGANGAGQLGDDSVEGRAQPAEVACLEGAVEVDAGEAHGCARLENGSVWCWGRGEEGQLGDGASRTSRVPVQVVGIEQAAGIAAGDRHSCALLHDGSVRCWGDNATGQLGDGTQLPRPTPVVVRELDDAVEIDAALGIDGASFSCARRRDGTVWCWGDDGAGQLGGAEGGPSPLPVRVAEIAAASSVALGAVHGCALEDDRVVCWGGLGAAPAALADLPAVAVAAGALHSCTLGTDHRIRCWGDDRDGQLGGPLDAATGIAVVEALGAPAAIAAGALHSCAVLDDGSAVCWGLNNNGRLGDGSVGGVRRTPVTVALDEL